MDGLNLRMLESSEKSIIGNKLQFEEVKFLQTKTHISDTKDIFDKSVEDSFQEGLLDEFHCNGEGHFVSELSLFQWFINLNLKLALEKETRLKDFPLTGIMNSEKWKDLVQKVIGFGSQLGLISQTSEEFIFPIARILSFAGNSYAKMARETLLKEFPLLIKKSFLQVFEEVIKNIFSRLNDRESIVLKYRDGLIDGHKKTLNEIGQLLDITRERVRQIESKGWKRLRHHQYKRFFLGPLIFYIMKIHGSLLVDINSFEAAPLQFICRCMNIPFYKWQNLIILGCSGKDWNFETFLKNEPLLSQIDASFIAKKIKAKLNFLISEDVEMLAKLINENMKKNLTKIQRVYLALRAIDKPAHYSEITDVHNSLFSDFYSLEHNIHAVLSRQNIKESEIVWVGIRGTYALKEWGYETPSKTLFNTVEEIVRRKYEETERPVSFSVIYAEIGKYRRIVQHSSLKFATNCNPNLRGIGHDLYVPKNSDEIREKCDKDELDQILREFEKEKNSQYSFSSNDEASVIEGTKFISQDEEIIDPLKKSNICEPEINIYHENISNEILLPSDEKSIDKKNEIVSENNNLEKFKFNRIYHNKSDDLDLVKWIKSIPHSTWFKMSKWAKEKRLLLGWERSLLYNIGKIVSNKWNLTIRQARQCKRIFEFLNKKGYKLN